MVVPYAEELATLMPVHEVRMRRDFTQLLTLVRAHALLHQCSRSRDPEGRITATISDYAAVHDIVQPIFAASLSAGLTPHVRETVLAVAALVVGPGATVTVSQVAERLGLTPAGAWYRIQVALNGRWLVNDETRKRQPAKLRVGEPMPKAPRLPSPNEVIETLKRTPEAVTEQEDARFNERFNQGNEGVQTEDPDDDARDAMREGA